MKYLLTLIFCFYWASGQAEEKIKLYCMFTPQFEVLLKDYFLPSLQDDFEVVVREFPEECPSGLFRSKGWNLVMLHKLELLKEAVKEHWGGRVFFYSDIDIIFLKPVLSRCLDLLKGCDFLVQQGWPRNALCAGFFVMRGNEKTLRLICEAEYLVQQDLETSDQTALNQVVQQMQGEIDWKFLPAEEFPNGRRVLSSLAKSYSQSSEIALPPSIYLFHANCCIGLDLKIDFLQRVQQEYMKMVKE